MITSTLLIFYLLAAPDLYFKRENGDTAVASGRVQDRWRRQLCVKTFLSNGAESEAQGTLSGFGTSVSLRYSIANDAAWILSIDRTDSGVRSFDAGVSISFFSVEELKQEERLPDRSKDLVLQTVKTPPYRIVTTIDKLLVPQERQLLLKAPKKAVYLAWGLPYYSELVSQLNMDEIPYATIATVDPDKAIASIYVNKTVVFIELRRRKLSEVEIAEFKTSLFATFSDLDADALEWKSLGTVETDLNAWSTGIWVNDSLNLIGDDGYCERFKLIDGKMVRVNEVTGLPAPTAICQVGSDIWLLSEKDEAIKASKVSWDGSTSYREIDLGRTSIDQAAQTVFDPEKLVWRMNYLLFVSVLPFLTAVLVALFVIWRVMKARRLSRSG